MSIDIAVAIIILSLKNDLKLKCNAKPKNCWHYDWWSSSDSKPFWTRVRKTTLSVRRFMCIMLRCRFGSMKMYTNHESTIAMHFFININCSYWCGQYFLNQHLSKNKSQSCTWPTSCGIFCKLWVHFMPLAQCTKILISRKKNP